jgi:hypothetical protein
MEKEKGLRVMTIGELWAALGEATDTEEFTALCEEAVRRGLVEGL